MYGHERRAKDKQQNRHVYHVGSVQRRLKDTRRIFEPSPVKLNFVKTASTIHSQKITTSNLCNPNELLLSFVHIIYIYLYSVTQTY